MAMIETVIPILRVENLEASRRYYTERLGFLSIGILTG